MLQIRHSLSVCSLANGHMGAFTFGAIIKNVDIRVQVWLRTYGCISPGEIPRGRLAGSCGEFIYFAF